MNPFVSVIIPTYNYAHFIVDSINSVLDQSYPKELIEIIVVDDGSTDATEEIILGMHNSKIKYVKQSNKGKANATTAAIALASGKYIFNLDADDYFLPQKLSKTIEIFERHPEVVHVATPALCITEANKKQYIEPLPSFLLNRSNNGINVLSFFYANRMLFGGGTTFAARSNVLKRIPIPDEVDMYIDEYLLLGALAAGNTFFLPEPLSVWRIHPKNYSGTSGQEEQILKNKRLMRASEGVLKSLDKLPLTPTIKTIYTLQHRIREMVAKETANQKTLHDIIIFLGFIIKSRCSLGTLRRHGAFNRLIPLAVLVGVKNIFKRKS